MIGSSRGQVLPEDWQIAYEQKDRFRVMKDMCRRGSYLPGANMHLNPELQPAISEANACLGALYDML